MARYEAGETLASIARTYDCSPPAISYVVARSRTRQVGTDGPSKPLPPAEPQLIKGSTAEPTATATAKPQASSPAPEDVQPSFGLPSKSPNHGDSPPVQPDTAPTLFAPRRDDNTPREAPMIEVNGFSRDVGRLAGPPDAAARPTAPMQRPPAPPAPASVGNGDHRRTLHLSLGNASPGNGSLALPEPANQPANPERASIVNDAARPAQQPAGERISVPAGPGQQDGQVSPRREHDGNGGRGPLEVQRPAYRGPERADNGSRRDGGGSFIDQDLRTRVDGDIAAFLAAFDAALVQDTQESRAGLREATDRLLRAGARTRIELERLEARMPLPPRDTAARGEPVWRQR